MYSVALSGLSFVNALVPGVLPFGQAQAENTPVCGLSRLWRFSPDSNKKQQAVWQGKIKSTSTYAPIIRLS